MATSVLKATISLGIGGLVTPYPSKNFTGTVSNNDGESGQIVTIGTTEESPTFTDITTNGICILENLDPTNYVQWGVAATVYSGRLLANAVPGSVAMFQLEAGKTLFMKSNVAPCRVRVINVGSA